MWPDLGLGEIVDGLTRLVRGMVVGLDPQHFAVDRTVEYAELLIEVDNGLGRVVDVRDQDPQSARLVRVDRHVQRLELELRRAEHERVPRPHLPWLRLRVQRRGRAEGRRVHEHGLAEPTLAPHELLDVRLRDHALRRLKEAERVEHRR